MYNGKRFWTCIVRHKIPSFGKYKGTLLEEYE